MKNQILFLLLFSIVITSCTSRELRETKSSNGQLLEQYQVIETKEGSFIKDGFYKRWFPNGQIKNQGDYVKGKRHGNWKLWFLNGQLSEDINFKKDSLDGDFKKWNENGIMINEGKYELGNLEGNWQSWHDNGQLKADKNYSNNKLDGKQIYWYANGQKRTEGNFIKGSKDGLWTYFDQDGKVYSENLYKIGNDVTLVGSKWVDKNKDTWEFFEDGSYILDIRKNGQRKNGTYKLNVGTFKLDNKELQLGYISRDSIYASRWISDWMYGKREVSKIQAKRIK